MLPQELREKILSQPLYRQREVKELLKTSDISLEHGRMGRGQFAGLKFAKMGKAVRYPAACIIDFLENLSIYSSTSEFTEAKRKEAAL